MYSRISPLDGAISQDKYPEIEYSINTPHTTKWHFCLCCRTDTINEQLVFDRLKPESQNSPEKINSLVLENGKITSIQLADYFARKMECNQFSIFPLVVVFY